MSVRSLILFGREPVQGASAWFDDLSNLQAASFLLALMTGMLAAAGGLLVATRMLGPTPAPARSTSVAAEYAPAAELPRSAPNLLLTERGGPDLRAATLVSTVNLRAEPTTSSPSLVVLQAHTDLVLLGDTAQTGNALWQHVRTEDEQEGWIIATAID